MRSMENSVLPSIAVNDHHSPYASPIVHIPLTTYSVRSEFPSIQALAHDAAEISGITSTHPDRLRHLHKFHLPLQVTPNPVNSLLDVKCQETYDFGTMCRPGLQPQVLIPNPLLSNTNRVDSCMSIHQHFLDSDTLLSSPSPLDYHLLGARSVPRLTIPLDRSTIGRASVLSQGTPVNDSAPELIEAFFSNPPVDQTLLKADGAQSPIIPIDEPIPKNNFISRDPSLDYFLGNEVTQQSQDEPTGQSFHPGLTRVNEGFDNDEYMRTQCFSNPRMSVVGTVSTHSSLANMENAAFFHMPNVMHVGGTQERGHQSGSADLNPAPQIPFVQETSVPSHQAEMPTMVNDLHSFGISERKPHGEQLDILRAREIPVQDGEVCNVIFDPSSSVQNHVTDSENKVSSMPQKKYLTKTSFQDRQKKKGVITLTAESKHRPVKRRRLGRPGDEQFEYQGYQPLDHIPQPDSDHTVLCSGALRSHEGELFHHFTKKKDANMPRKHQSLDQKSCEMSKQLQICRRSVLERSSEHKSSTKEKNLTDYFAAKTSPNSEQSPGEMLQGKVEIERECFEEQEVVDAGNGFVVNQENFVDSETSGSTSPSHIVRAVEQKEGCMYMILDVHKPEICQSCDKKFPTKELMDLHVSKKHERSSRRRYRKRKRQPREYRCEVCNLLLANDANLRRHYKIAHEGETVDACSLCNANFNSRHGLVLHLRDMHGIIPDSVQEKEGRNRNKRHYRKRKSAIAVPKPTWVVWKCGSCPFFSQNKGNMTRHINIVHLKIADYECDECSEVFKTKHNLQVHLMNRHPKKPEERVDK